MRCPPCPLPQAVGAGAVMAGTSPSSPCGASVAWVLSARRARPAPPAPRCSCFLGSSRGGIPGKGSSAKPWARLHPSPGRAQPGSAHKGEGNDAAVRYGARKAVWLRRSAYRRHGAPAPRNGAPDRKMPCSMVALPRNPFLGKQNCTLNTPRARLAPTGSFSAERCHSIPLGARGARDGTGQDDGSGWDRTDGEFTPKLPVDVGGTPAPG